MNVPVSLQEYAQLVRRINAEIANHLSEVFSGSTSIKTLDQDELDAGVVFAAQNHTRRVSIKSVIIPFGFDHSMSLQAEIDRAVIVASGASLQLPNSAWSDDGTFAENGIMSLCLPSLDADAVAAAADVIATEIEAHLSFERELVF